MYQLQSKETKRQPLIYLQQANIAIFPHQIVRYQNFKNKTISSLTTNISLPQIQSKDQIISFQKQDIAFKINEELKKVQIVRIKKQKIQLEFTVNALPTLSIVQDILRRKLCEIGFQEKYCLIKQLGKGATAKVYLTERKSDKKLFAAKIISIKQSQNNAYDTFINQTKLLRHLKNKHIVGIQSLYISKKQLICLLEYLQGGTLLEELKQDRLKTHREKFKPIRDIAQGIEHLRQKRIVHRDLKLQNIMIRITPDLGKQYVITDFGLACWVGQKELLYQRCGTPGYIAPQILRAGRNKIIVSHVSDIFSFGIICHLMYFMFLQRLMLKSVFSFSGDVKKLLLDNKKASFSLTTSEHYDLSSSQRDILIKTLQIDPSKRVDSQQLLEVWIKKLQKDVNINEKKYIKRSKSQRQDESETKRMKMKGKSIEMIEKRAASIQKINLTNRIKTEQNQPKKQKKSNSVSKFFSKVWNAMALSQTESIKTKQQVTTRKKEMQQFVN